MTLTPVRADPASSKDIKTALLEQKLMAGSYISVAMKRLRILNEDIPGSIQGLKSIEQSFEAWFHDEIEAPLNKLAGEAEDGRQ